VDDWEDYNWDDPEDWPWDEIEHIHALRDDSGWEISVEMGDGTLVDILDGIDDDTAQDLIWDEIYHLADDWGVDFDKEVEYAKE
jgi:hypothetical protein